MNLSEINPHIRFAQEIRLPSQKAAHIACDSRCSFIKSGYGALICGGVEYKLNPKSIVIIPPGIAYRYHSEDILEIISINFDYTKSRSDIVAALFPKSISEFDRSMITEMPEFQDCQMLSYPIKLDNAADLERDCQMLSEEFLSKRNFSSEIASAIMKGIVFKIIRAITADKRIEKKADVILSYIRAHYAENLSNEFISEMFGYHPYHINRLIKASTGMTVHKYLGMIRIESAKRLLSESDKSVSEIAELCGYDGISTFSRDFKLRVGSTPLEYRKYNLL